MSLRATRLGLAAGLSVVAALALAFYHRQNSGEHLGGPISLPKTLWLAYAVAAWLVVPFFLWRDERLDARVRRLFGVYWWLWIVRGAVELVLLLGFQHWTPLYGISHDALCLLALFWLQRGVRPNDVLSRRALRFSGALIVSLCAEIAFASMFWQTGAHEQAVYFAAGTAQWGYINLVTWLALAALYPDFIAMLLLLYFPGTLREPPRLVRWGRATAGVITALMVIAAAVFYGHMMQVERKGARFQRVGYEIVDSCVQFKEAFIASDEQAMADFVVEGDASWQIVTAEHPHPFELKRWWSDGPRQSLPEFLSSWRRGLPEVRQAVFKIHLLDEVLSDRDAVAQIRFEVTSHNTTDAGLIRCRFAKCEDARWRITDSSLIEGTTVAGPGNYFVDVAKERGLDFAMQPDERLLPGACENRPDAIPLKFQTMRHAYAGCATADVDNDGWDDVLMCSGGRPALFRNRGDGTFEDITERSGLGQLRHVNTAGFADLDNDGKQDLFLAAFYENCWLFRGRGDGTFVDVTAASGLKQHGMVTCFSFFDYNRDGRLDLYLGRFLHSRTAIPDSFLYARNGEPNVLYHNDGGLRFADVTDAAAVGDLGLTLSLAAADYDGDGWQDLYVANDFGRNVLYKNRGDGTFEDVAKRAGALAIGGSMSASWGDYDNDGRLDLYVAAIRSNQRWFVQPITARRVLYKFVREGRLLAANPLFRDLKDNLGDDWVEVGNHALSGNSLLRQNADGTFTDGAERANARPAGWYWSSGFFDIDNDGWLDIYATDGWISGKDAYDL
jgi:hypothetical protein